MNVNWRAVAKKTFEMQKMKPDMKQISVKSHVWKWNVAYFFLKKLKLVQMDLSHFKKCKHAQSKSDTNHCESSLLKSVSSLLKLPVQSLSAQIHSLQISAMMVNPMQFLHTTRLCKSYSNKMQTKTIDVISHSFTHYQ